MFTNNHLKLWELIYFANRTNQKRHFQQNLKVPYSNPTDICTEMSMYILLLNKAYYII